ncbi:hypothetical protein ASG47_05725 [Devosia sp. Leaf420]|uniref:hypothetical protein n=1 Tax=Devosia sp. Leaf420 TaxID=1736374 RepID=UPI00071394B7|nr:hypothetical protein [Devosia sp. Leaf420]KQT49802.1 hypothetical protein ASG47_05725 [Devosia sp. Leaf420]
MKLYAVGVLAGLATVSSATVFAADYGALPPLRPAYPQEWETPASDPLRIELGVRYWYSIGKQDHQIGNYSQSVDSKSHVGEVFARVEDHSTRSYLEAFGGYGVAHEGTYTTNGGTPQTLPAYRLGYAGADFAYLPFGGDSVGLGFITGYQYTNDSPDTGRANFYTGGTTQVGGLYQLSGGDSEINNFEIHQLKLGLATKFDTGSFDILGEAAAIPYSWITGTYGAYQGAPLGPYFGQGSAAAVNGHAYGATGKLMVGFKPTENLAIRLGGRATYLTGQYDVTYNTYQVTQPATAGDPPTVSQQNYISNNNPFSMLRYGALLEVAGSF